MYIQSFFIPILFVIALSVDAFAASLAYGTSKIKIPGVSILLISLICSLSLAVSLFFGSAVSSLLPGHWAKIICFIILFAIGIIKLFDSSIKNHIRRHPHISREITFSALHMNFILNVYANPEEADKDASHRLSASEAVALSIALSIDSLAAGFGAAMALDHAFFMVVLSLLVNTAAVPLGAFLGNQISKKSHSNFSWFSGLLLILLAVLKAL